MLRVDVMAAPAAQLRVVQDESLPVGPELARADPAAGPDDRFRQAVRLEQLHRAVLDHPGFHPGPEPIRFLPLQDDGRNPSPLEQVRGDQPGWAGPYDAYDRITQPHSQPCSPTVNDGSTGPAGRPGTDPGAGPVIPQTDKHRPSEAGIPACRDA